MEDADVVMLVGARLNWLLSRGQGKWNKQGKFIQLDIEPTEIDANRHIDAPVIGDLRSSLEAIIAKIESKGVKFAMDSAWVPGIQAESKVKNAKFLERLQPQTVPMTHWSALGAAKKVLEANPDVILVNEGANTLDDTRDSIDMFLPRHRIDCATWAIMGMGMGSAIGAAVASGKSVVAIEGDSAFGFSGMDFSTICRFNLPVTVCIFNNGGIYNGIGKPLDNTTDPAPTTLDINARYDKLGEAFGAQTYYVTTPDEFGKALAEGIASKKPCLIDVQLAADSGKESGHIGIAAAIETGKPVLAVEGDSAFGFCGMEVETICRYNLPVCVVVFNNNGIYRGTDVNAGGSDPATTVFVKGARYDKMMEAFGGVGVNATSPDELKRAVNEAMDSGKPTLINAVIDPAAGSESGRIGNLNPQSALKKK